jgi:copper chaperone NosL
MTIVGKAYAAQAVSTKGKQYKYDAIECMVHDLLQNQNEMAIQQVANYFDPGSMIKVDQALFIMNDSIDSPMGKHLAAIPKEHPMAVKNVPDLLRWKALVALFGKPSLTLNH